MKNITISYEQLTNIIRSSQMAFIETGKYSLTRREADEQFGRATINLLISNKLLNDTRISKAERVKCRFLISDIVTAIEAFEKL